MHTEQEQTTKNPLMSPNKTVIQGLEPPDDNIRPKSSKKTIIIAEIVILVVFGGIWAINAIIDDMKRKEDIQHEILEKKRYERILTFYAITDKAKNLAEYGYNTKNENYEQKLIEAYLTYEEVERDATNVEHLGANIPDVSAEKQKLIDALQTALVVIRRQVPILKANGESVLASEYENKAKKIEQFILTHK